MPLRATAWAWAASGAVAASSRAPSMCHSTAARREARPPGSGAVWRWGRRWAGMAEAWGKAEEGA
ncbi:hypothetical protein Acidovoranil_27680 [Acidovorax sp. FG27]